LLGTAAAVAALAEAEDERAELERRIADSDLERERLTQQATELRDQLHRSQFRWAQLAEVTSKLHTMAIEGVES
jgi:hypothetical protein